MARYFIEYILIAAEWQRCCIFLLKIVLKECATFIGVDSKFQVHIDILLDLEMQQ